jgi:hypothetical protein
MKTNFLRNQFSKVLTFVLFSFFVVNTVSAQHCWCLSEIPNLTCYQKEKIHQLFESQQCEMKCSMQHHGGMACCAEPTSKHDPLLWGIRNILNDSQRIAFYNLLKERTGCGETGIVCGYKYCPKHSEGCCNTGGCGRGHRSACHGDKCEK